MRRHQVLDTQLNKVGRFLYFVNNHSIWWMEHVRISIELSHVSVFCEHLVLSQEPGSVLFMKNFFFLEARSVLSFL